MDEVINQNLRVLDLIKFCKKEAELECLELYTFIIHSNVATFMMLNYMLIFHCILKTKQHFFQNKSTLVD